MKWRLPLAAVGEYQCRPGADQVQRLAFVTCPFYYLDIGGDQSFFHLVITVKEENPVTRCLFKTAIARGTGGVMALGGDHNIEITALVGLLEVLQHLQ